MTTTISRKIRRFEPAMQAILDAYDESPRGALKGCHDTFGRQQFESALRFYLTKQSIKTALRSTILFCLTKEALLGTTIPAPARKTR